MTALARLRAPGDEIADYLTPDVAASVRDRQPAADRITHGPQVLAGPCHGGIDVTQAEAVGAATGAPVGA
jgi:hypothetical protein